MLRLGEPAVFGLGKNDLTVHDHIKDPSASGDQGDLLTQSLTHFIRQTGGPGQIISLRAIMNFNLHTIPLTDIPCQC